MGKPSSEEGRRGSSGPIVEFDLEKKGKVNLIQYLTAERRKEANLHRKKRAIAKSKANGRKKGLVAFMHGRKKGREGGWTFGKLKKKE